MEIIDTPIAKHDLKASLNKYFGFDGFKLNQEKIIDNILAGKDTFVLMPTGGGKSLCYQLPALMLDGMALVVSPLIALMKNQVDSIRSYSDKESVAHYLNSSLNKGQIETVRSDVMSGQTKLLFIAPETLTKEENISFLKKANVSFVAIDEAHCISEWGHDFRPEYRNIRKMIDNIGDNIPVMALTATATPKVRTDIVKNLKLKQEETFVSSFNRDNLYYEIRPKVSKEQTIKEIVQLIKSMPGKSGIIYVQARKSTEEIAQLLQVNGIRSAAYHAGLDAKTRNKVQDDFLMERSDVIVATIAFGMGIDKPDVRFVFHYDIPKSLENYYQETGRAGRDGINSTCVAFYSYKDILRLEKFNKDKSFSEREMNSQLLEEIIAFSESSACRRKFLLHYFGEQFDDDCCIKMCDNCKNPREKQKINEEMVMALKAVETLNQNYKITLLVDFMTGRNTGEIKELRFDQKVTFGAGKDKDVLFWHSVFRHAILNNLLYKEVEQYGILKLTDLGASYISKPFDVNLPIYKDYSSEKSADIVTNSTSAGVALDDVLFKALKDLRRSEAQSRNMQPWIMFMDPPLQDMATYYPITMDELVQLPGVSQGKARKFGTPFLLLIKAYVEENNIERPQDVVVKQIANKSKSKVSIIQGIDRKLPLEDIASNNGHSLEDLLDEMNLIVNSGTKLDINYYIEENIDDDVVEEIFDFFQEAETGTVEEAFDELKDEDINREEIQIVRIKFMSTVAN